MNSNGHSFITLTKQFTWMSHKNHFHVDFLLASLQTCFSLFYSICLQSFATNCKYMMKKKNETLRIESNNFITVAGCYCLSILLNFSIERNIGCKKMKNKNCFFSYNYNSHLSYTIMSLWVSILVFLILELKLLFFLLLLTFIKNHSLWS